MPQLVEVKFKGNRKAFFEWHEPEPLRSAEPVIVESERGLDFGVVYSTGAVAQTKCDRCMGCAVGGGDEDGKAESTRAQPEPVRKIVRRASQGDRRTMEELRRHEDDVRRKVREKARQHNLVMKVSDAEWQWDRNRLTVYFTADKRVDFRALVRDLAATFRTRIELRQIGVRDEAARLSGIGRCGRELCSASWLPELRPIGLQIAKDQRLSLNPAQISGPCGRLLCCLRYEHEFYVQSRKRFPKEGKLLRTLKGAEKVQSVDIFRDRVTLKGEDGTYRTVALADLKQEVDQAAAAPAEQQVGALGSASGTQGSAPGAQGSTPAGPPPEGGARQRHVPRDDRRAQPREPHGDRRSPQRPDRRGPERRGPERSGPERSGVPSGHASAEPGPGPGEPTPEQTSSGGSQEGGQHGRRRRGRRGGRRRHKGGPGGGNGGGPGGQPPQGGPAA